MVFVSVAALLLVLAVLAMIFRGGRVHPALTVHFTGKISPGIHVHPFGEFVITNVGNRAVHWWRGEVEAPTDTSLSFSAGMDSTMRWGTLEPGGSTNFPAIVPKAKGAPFRIQVSYRTEPPRVIRAVQIIHLFWARMNGSVTVTSQWFYASEDYTNAPPPFGQLP